METPENPTENPAPASAAAPSLKELVQTEAMNLKGTLALKLAALQDAAAMFVGARVAPHLPKACLIVAVIAICVGIPVALPGMVIRALLIVLPIVALALLLGLCSSQSRLSHLGMLIAAVAVVETVGASIYFRYDRQVDKNNQQQTAIEDVQTVANKHAAQKRADDEKAKAEAEQARLQAEADDRIKKQQDQIEQEKYQHNQALLAEQAAARKRADDDARAKEAKRKEDEDKRRKAEELANKVKAIDKADALELAKKNYQEKSQNVDKLTEKLTALEAEAKVAKEQIARKQEILDLAPSPTPPSAEELAKAQKSHDQWKEKSDKLQAQLPVMRADLEQATKEKQQAGTLLDTLQKQ